MSIQSSSACRFRCPPLLLAILCFCCGLGGGFLSLKRALERSYETGEIAEQSVPLMEFVQGFFSGAVLFGVCILMLMVWGKIIAWCAGRPTQMGRAEFSRRVEELRNEDNQ